jgi:prephenate dehydrogenase
VKTGEPGAPQFPTAAIVGVGLLGASLGLALKAHGLAGRVVGAGRRQASLETAQRIGAIDALTLSATDAAREADLVVLCTPANLVCAKLDEVLPVLRADAVVTDVASTKRTICRHARETWPAPCRFVGSHPMAGSEKFGPEHGHASLYQGSVVLLEARAPHHDPPAHAAVAALWEGVGARVIPVDPEAHDPGLAVTSHLPHLVAGLAAQTAAAADPVRGMAGNGFRDTTRVAAGRPELWRDICLTNRDAIVAGLDAFLERGAVLRDLVARGDGPGLEAFLAAGAEARARVLGE